ncbi:DUF6934 family protein [Hymenobacter sp. B1770]|uniref:DUF6934 family protein n=1 Tax=Hymenobacter sp. B1770 TaxID=1718788 RepID=UPI003CEA9D69
MKNISTYPLREADDEPKNRKFFFKSIGKLTIVKVVEYMYVQPYGLGGLYNLAFGDYDKATRSIIDDTNSNNDDIRPVMNTVLSTIPLFFDEYPYATIAVQGSDSGAEFEIQCRITCLNKRCDATCRNADRRINSYRYFLNKNYDELKETYVFSGYIRALSQKFPYRPDVKYDAVFVSKK